MLNMGKEQLFLLFQVLSVLAAIAFIASLFFLHNTILTIIAFILLAVFSVAGAMLKGRNPVKWYSASTKMIKP